MAAIIKQFMIPLDKEPKRGRAIKIFMHGGGVIEGHCTLIIEGNHEYLMYYDNNTRKAVPIKYMKGWCYA